MSEQQPVGELSYEQAREQLVQVVQQLESGGATLSESLELWERHSLCTSPGRPPAAWTMVPSAPQARFTSSMTWACVSATPRFGATRVARAESHAARARWMPP